MSVREWQFSVQDTSMRGAAFCNVFVALVQLIKFTCHTRLLDSQDIHAMVITAAGGKYY